MPTPCLRIESPWGQHTVYPAHEQARARISEILRRANMPLNTRCGEHGRCDGCIVELIEGSVVHVATGQSVTSNGQARAIRACEHHLAGDQPVALRIPQRAVLAYQPHVLTDFRINVPCAHDPLYQCVEVSEAELGQDEPYFDAIRRVVAERRCMKVAPRLDEHFFRTRHDAHGRFVTLEYRAGQWTIMDISAERPVRDIGVAIDIGTTTVAVLLVDLKTGKVLGQAAGFNQQMRLGDDVVTRISLCAQPAMLPRLQEAVVDATIAKLLEEALTRASILPRWLACFTIAGNTTMLHLFVGVDPSPMGIAPFTPAFLDHRILDFGSLWPKTSKLAEGGAGERVAVHLLPGAAAYIGADLTGGVVASGLLYDEGPSLLVDVGTNGEIILKLGDRLLGCATAAGPAFEGAGLSCGMRAGVGAISHVRMNMNTGTDFGMEFGTIGPEGTRPVGICGSAYVDFLAEARKVGLLEPSGRFRAPASRRIASELIVPWPTNSAQRGPRDTALRIPACPNVVISQADVASLLQAKAAIAAGILILLRNAKVKPEDIKTVYLAGGFGTHISPANAIACGLLPGFRPEQIQPVGNTSLAGAYMALLDASILQEIGRVGKNLEVIELNLDPEFEGTYIDQLALE